MAAEIALKIDVCNHRALHEGVPGMVGLLRDCDVRASFFVAFGPDRSGLAVRRLFRPGFASKMLRTGAVRMYGIKTLFYGTVLPAPYVGESRPDLLCKLEAEGHEVGLHGWDHVGWQDGLVRMREPEIRRSLEQGAEAFENALGHSPRFSGASGWQANDASLVAQETLGLEFASDCREGEPFWPVVHGSRLATLQLPTSLPTSDELLGRDGICAADLSEWYLERLHRDRMNVLGVHAEAEGIHYSGWLRSFLATARERGFRFRLLSEVADQVRSRAPDRRLTLASIAGRAGRVAVPSSE